MAGIDVTVEGLNDLLKNIDVLKDNERTAVAAALGVVSQEIAQYAQQNHAFNNRTGNLEASIQALPIEEEAGQPVSGVKAGMEYAPYVEFGTSRSAPYPFLVPAVEANKQNLLDTVAKAVERAKQVVKVERS